MLEGKDIVPPPYWGEPMQKMKSSISIHRLALHHSNPRTWKIWYYLSSCSSVACCNRKWIGYNNCSNKYDRLAEAQTCLLSDILRTVHRDIFLQWSQLGALISQIYFWNRNLHVSDSISFHHQESSTVHTAIGLGHRDYADCLLAGSWTRYQK